MGHYDEEPDLRDTTPTKSPTIADLIKSMQPEGILLRMNDIFVEYTEAKRKAIRDFISLEKQLGGTYLYVEVTKVPGMYWSNSKITKENVIGRKVILDVSPDLVHYPTPGVLSLHGYLMRLDETATLTNTQMWLAHDEFKILKVMTWEERRKIS